MSASVALARSDWRRHDIVYSPELRMYGTVSSVSDAGGCLVEWSDGVRVEYPARFLDEWQRANDERGHP